MPIDDVIEVVPGPPAGAPRRRRRLGVATVAAMLLVAGGVTAWAIGRGGSAADAAGGGRECPASMPTSSSPFDAAAVVPALPTASGVDGRFVPERAPASVLVCEYGGAAWASGFPGADDPAPPANPHTSAAVEPGSPATPLAVDRTLSRSVEMGGTSTTATALLAVLHPAPVQADYVSCMESINGHAVPTYLVRLEYDEGVVWVAQVNCGVVTNGVTIAALDLSSVAKAALTAATEAGPDLTGSSSASEVDPPAATDPGSPGVTDVPGAATDLPASPSPTDPFASCSAVFPADGALVPFVPVSVRICSGTAVFPDPADAPGPTDQPASVAVELADALADLAASDPDQACTAIGGQTWRLLFTADDGTQAQVDADAGGCGTVTNGVLTVQADTALFARLQALS